MIVDERGLVAPSDIAEIAGVSRGAVSNWRKRAEDFPDAVGGTASRPLFQREAVTEWLTARGYEIKQDRGEVGVWAALNEFRGQTSLDAMAEMILSLACVRLLSVESTDVLDPWIRIRNDVVNGGFVVVDAVRDDMAQTDERWSRLVTIPPDLVRMAGPLPYRLVDVVDQVRLEDLSAVVDYVLNRIATVQVRSGAEFGFVGSRTSRLLGNLAAAGGNGGVVYDPACGVASALLATIQAEARPARIVGHDINNWALRVAAQRAFLNGHSVELLCTDVLSEDIDPELEADTIVAEPPFGLRWDSSNSLFDSRFEFGTPPSSSADMAWLQHAIAHLTATGRGYVLTPMGPLFRGGQEKVIRTEMVRRGCVEAVFGLPGKMLPHVSIPLALWVVCRPGAAQRPGEILLVDGSEVESPEDEIAGWWSLPSSDSDQPPHSVVTVADALAAEANLSPQWWIEAPGRDPGEVAAEYADGWKAINETLARVKGTHRTLELLSAVPPARVLTIGELIDQGVLELKSGRPRDKAVVLPPELAQRVVTPGDVQDGTLNDFDDPGDVLAANSDLTWAGDVLVTTMHKVRTRVDETGGHLPSTGVYRLRITNTDQMAPDYLALVLTGSWNERFLAGSTIQRASIRSLEVPLVPKKDQTDLRIATLAVRLLAEEAAHLATNAQTVGNALLDAVRYNAPLARNGSDVGAIRQDADDTKDQGHK